MNESGMEISFLEKQISLGKAMQRLNDNNDFKEIFLDGYVANTSKDISKGYCLLDEVRRERAQKDLYAISFFSQFCDLIIDNANNAIESMRDLKEQEAFESEVKGA